MQISIRHACVDPDDQPFDVAERKGVGHPDSLADLLADAFSQRYSSWCLREFGAIPNHWMDKVNLVSPGQGRCQQRLSCCDRPSDWVSPLGLVVTHA
uniref:S-adenosylmethionine synthetase-like protein n=1 Tax=Salinispora arenicola (strain CNS-205) TaxID=391037 RepID=A8LZA0_SALAI